MGVLTRPSSQLVFVDTPGLHKPVSALGERVNSTALESASDVDMQCLVLDATRAFGTGDQWVADRLQRDRLVVVVNKVDIATRDQVIAMLGAASELDASLTPVSRKVARGLTASSIFCSTSCRGASMVSRRTATT